MLTKKSFNFREFFQERYFQVDRKYVDISMPKLFSEMAERLDVGKLPAKLDKDDIEFLHQFPSQYWTQALHQRYYDDMKEALKERNSRRTPHEQKLHAVLKKAFVGGEYGKVQNLVSDELFYRMQNQEFDHIRGEEGLGEKAAAKYAEIETEKKFPHVSYPPQEEGLPPGYKKYTFKKNRNDNKMITIAAKPWANRLVHKLEKTRGQEHHPDSGLKELGTTHGEYGYDLYGLKEGDDNVPHSTRGMQLPPRHEIAARLSDFLGHNAHGMYGKLADGPDITWKPAGEGRSTFKDNWSWKKIYNKSYPQWVQKLTSAEPGTITMPDGTKTPPEKGFKLESHKQAAARLLAMDEIFTMAEHGQLTGPPIPGVAPDGLKVKVKIGKKGKKMIDAPPLYLPHQKKAVRVRNDQGGVDTKMVDMPLVNPTEYLRSLGSEESDEAGVEEEDVRGYEKDYVAVPHMDFKKGKKGYLASGALHLTHNTAGRMHMDPSDSDYEERKEEIEEEMGYMGLDRNNKPSKGGEGQYFYDIVKGIWNCINSNCGGMTAHEVRVMKDNVADLHQMVYQRMMMNLRDPKLDNASGRRAFAKNVASSWAQQDLGQGGGTRRLRRLSQDARDASMDADTEGNQGGTLSLRDSIQSRMKSQGGESSSSFGGGEKLKPGEKKLPAGQHQFSYNLDNLRTIISELEGEAEQVDSSRDEAIRLSRMEISDQIAELIGDAVADKVALVFQLQYHLTNLFQTTGIPPNEAEMKSQQKIEEYTAGGKAKAKQIVSAFKADGEIQQLLSGPVSGTTDQLGEGDKELIDGFEDILGQLSASKKKEPATQQMIYNYIEDDERFGPAVKAEMKKMADAAFGKTTPAPTAPAAAPAAKPVNSGEVEVNGLIGQKNWLRVAKHPYFLYIANPQQLTALTAKLTASMAEMPEGLDKEDHEFAIAHLNSVLQKRQTGGLSGI